MLWLGVGHTGPDKKKQRLYFTIELFLGEGAAGGKEEIAGWANTPYRGRKETDTALTTTVRQGLGLRGNTPGTAQSFPLAPTALREAL